MHGYKAAVLEKISISLAQCEALARYVVVLEMFCHLATLIASVARLVWFLLRGAMRRVDGLLRNRTAYDRGVS